MTLSSLGKRLLTRLEGIRLEIYKDQGGKETVGVGHLLKAGPVLWIGGEKIDAREGITKQQAMDLLDEDISVYEAVVNAHVRYKLNQQQFDALVIFCFNVGVGAFRRSTLLLVLNANRPEYVPLEMKRWVYVNGEVSEGLKNRREREIKLFKEGEY